MPLTVDHSLDSEYSVRMTNAFNGSQQWRVRLAEWMKGPDTVGQVALIDYPPDLLLRFSDRDTAFAAEMLFGSMFEYRGDLYSGVNREQYTSWAEYRGPLDVATLVELRDWLGELEADSWMLEIERMVQPELLEVTRVYVLRFKSHHDAFAFRMRWNLPRGRA